MTNSRDMKLRIVACQQIYSGMNPKGHRYTIFEIEAAKPDGQLINEKLRAFEALPVGEMIDVTVTPFESEAHGRSFTLHRKGSNNATAHINELRGTVEVLMERVTELEQRMAKVEAELQSKTPSTQGW